MSTPRGIAGRGRGWGLEATAAALTCVVFLGCLGSLELWGKREQRLAAEVLDTVEHGRWLVARIQGRPRLEKPPLARWATATLAMAVGRLDETVLRIPGAFAALGTVALTYMLGLRLGGRRVGLASALILATTPLFISEARQAGQDLPLAFFTSLAIYAAVRRLEDEAKASRRWSIAFHAALGLGFLCKGPVILAIVAAALAPWACFQSNRGKLARLTLDPIGLGVFLALALCWPVPVWLAEPNAAGVWAAEIGQKTGALPIAHRERASFLMQWPALVLPWIVAGIAGVVQPFRRSGGIEGPARWLAWSWSVGVAILLGFWAVAKPNYYVPCLPGFAIMAAAGWARLERRAFGDSPERSARLLVYLQWAIWTVLGAGCLAAAGRALDAPSPAWCGLMAAVVAVAGLAGAFGSRRGWGPASFLPALAAAAVAVVVGYGVVAPGANATRGHAGVARAIDAAVPAEVGTVAFFHELDEGLWFYLRDRRLAPVPGSQPRFNDAFDQIAGSAGEGAPMPPGLVARSKVVLADWLRSGESAGSYVLLRDKVHRALAAQLEGVATLVLAEDGAKRNGLVLLRVDAPPRVASSGTETPLR